MNTNTVAFNWGRILLQHQSNVFNRPDFAEHQLQLLLGGLERQALDEQLGRLHVGGVLELFALLFVAQHARDEGGPAVDQAPIEGEGQLHLVLRTRMKDA